MERNDDVMTLNMWIFFRLPSFEELPNLCVRVAHGILGGVGELAEPGEGDADRQCLHAHPPPALQHSIHKGNSKLKCM